MHGFSTREGMQNPNKIADVLYGWFQKWSVCLHCGFRIVRPRPTTTMNWPRPSVLPTVRQSARPLSVGGRSDDLVSPSFNHPMSEREACYIVRRNLVILATEGGHSISLKCSAELFRVRNKARIVSLAPHTLSWGWKFGLDYEETSDRWKMF